jgi:hypothetical protein
MGQEPASKAPKARHATAWANGPGARNHLTPEALKARNKTTNEGDLIASIPLENRFRGAARWGSKLSRAFSA